MRRKQKKFLNLRAGFDVICIGRVVEDITLSGEIFKPTCKNGSCQEVLPLGTKNGVEELQRGFGGNALNASVTFARQQLKTALLSQISQGIFSKSLEDYLLNQKISNKLILKDLKFSNPTSIILLAPTGERTTLAYRGSKINTDSLVAKLRKVKSSWVYISSTNSIKLTKAAFEYAQNINAKIAFNPGSKDLEEIDSTRKLLEEVEVLVLNKEEARLFFGDLNPKSLARAGSEYSKICVVTDGPSGSFASSNGLDFFQPIYKEVKIVDRNGAGDAFASGLVASLIKGSGIEEALEFGAKNSTSVVQQVGAQSGIL